MRRGITLLETCDKLLSMGRELSETTFQRAMKKKPYSPPAVKILTPEQARKLIATRRNCTEEEAAKFLESLQQQQRQNDQGPNEAQNESKEQERKRSA
jgi:hypothetical protein